MERDILYLTKYLFVYELNENKALLLNTLSGALDVIENNELEYLRKGLFTYLSDATLSLLRERGYLFSSPEDETRVLDYIRQRLRIIPPNPPLFYISPTYQCNLRCVYCNEWDMPNEARIGVMSPQQINQAFKAILVILKDRDFKDKVEITLFGGEPLLPSTRLAVKLILEKARENRFRVRVITNGVYIINFLALFSALSR